MLVCPAVKNQITTELTFPKKNDIKNTFDVLGNNKRSLIWKMILASCF